MIFRHKIGVGPGNAPVFRIRPGDKLINIRNNLCNPHSSDGNCQLTQILKNRGENIEVSTLSKAAVFAMYRPAYVGNAQSLSYVSMTKLHTHGLHVSGKAPVSQL